MRYEEADVDEAIDLIECLPAGSLWAGATDVDAAWPAERYLAAQAVDLLSVMAHRLYITSEHKPLRRPRDVARDREEAERARRVHDVLTDTSVAWREVDHA